MTLADPDLRHVENGAWRDLPRGGWEQLHGSFRRGGISVELHRFRTDRELPWDRSFHPDSLEICLNLQGTARLGAAGRETELGVREVAFYAPPAGTAVVGGSRRVGGLSAVRAPGAPHHFVTVEMSREFLAARLGAATPGALHPSVGAYLGGGEADGGDAGIAGGFVETRPMSVAVQNNARALAEPPLRADSEGGRLWYGAKVVELISLLLFAPTETIPAAAPEMFCVRQKRLAGERAEAARALLERDLANPPSLEMLAAAVGCGAFYLSRAFSAAIGQTIPQYVRRLRLERAARMLREGRGNVTDAAFAVGYQSLSHFSKAFHEMFGCCPGLYANPRLAAAATHRRRGAGVVPGR